ncbi:MAG: BtpA/SgcQ family protein [bacterium]|nr:BtpA/SgcQ family protein [bacterium]
MQIFHSPKPVLGMLHCPALPGSPGFGGDRAAIAEAVLRDAETLVAAGIDGLMLENFHDTPFYPGSVPPEAIAEMTALAVAVRSRFDVPLGINMLRNDGRAALAVAAAAGAQLIRVNVLCGARLTDQGIVQGIAHDLLRDRVRLGAESIEILADVDVKHSVALAARPLEEEIDDVVHRGKADGLVVSGAATGRPTHLEDAQRAKAAAGDVPIFVGSGVTPETAAEYLAVADGVIVGTSLKRGGIGSEPVDGERVRRLLERCER